MKIKNLFKKQQNPNDAEEPHYLTSGIRIFLIFIFIFFIWAIFAPINSSIITNGEIILTSNKKTISHFSGGIIEEINIKEGEFVEEGQNLIILSTVAVKAKINQTLESIKAAQFQKTATIKLINTLKEELKIVNELLKNANTSLTRKLDLQKQLNETEGKLGGIIANISSLQSEYQANKFLLERSAVQAPVSGFVMDLKYQTIGSVIPPANEIMFIVPKNDRLIAEVKVKPQDIDLLYQGMDARIQLTAYNTRLMPKLNGKLINVSADSFKNEMNGEVYFKARVEIPESEMKKLKVNIKLIPGMPVNVFLITGSRSLLKYLITPISESAYKAFRED